MAEERVNREIDASSPYFLHPNENPALILVDQPLDGKNYHAWSRAMRMVLISNNKLGFVDGSLPKPPDTDRLAFKWSQCDTTVVSWLLKTVTPSIARTVIWSNTARDIWNDLKLRYSNMDVFRLSDLLEELNHTTQGNQSVTEYFSRFKPIKDEISILKPIPSCECAVKCTCKVIPTFVGYIESEYVVRFMKGLNENFASVRSQVYLLKPLPTIADAFAMCIQHERQMEYTANHPQQLQSNVFVNKSQFDNSTGHGNSSYVSDRGGQIGNYSGERFQGTGYNNDRNKSSGNQYNREKKGKCTFCGYKGHTIDVCYKKNGYPADRKPIKRIDMVDTDNSMVHSTISDHSQEVTTGIGLTTQQLQRLTKFLDTMTFDDKVQPQANQVSCLLSSSFEKIVSLNKSYTSIDDLPNGLVVEILSRLPVKTLVLSTCVSKKWCFIIKSPSLISAHLSRSISDPASKYHIFLIHTVISPEVNVFSDIGHRLIRHPDFNLPFETQSRSLKLIGSCNGLICITDHSEKYEGRDIYLLNPFLNKYRKLAVDSSSYVDLIGEINNKTVDLKVGFGYSEVENDYKVVRIIFFRDSDIVTTPKVEIYSLKSGEWKRVNVSIKILKPSSYENPVFAHGCLYWHVEDYAGEMKDYLLCFHLKDEVFSKIKLPATYYKLHGSWDRCNVAKNDSIAVVLHTYGPNNSMRICILVLEKNMKWKEFKYECGEFSIKKCLGFSRCGRLIMNWGFPEKYLVAIDLDNTCAMEKVDLYNTYIDDYFYGAVNVVESLVLFSD